MEKHTISCPAPASGPAFARLGTGQGWGGKKLLLELPEGVGLCEKGFVYREGSANILCRGMKKQVVDKISDELPISNLFLAPYNEAYPPR